MRPIPKRFLGKPTGPIQQAVGRVLDVSGAALFFNKDERWVRRRIDRKLIPCRKFAGRWIFLRSELEALIDGLQGTSLAEAKKNLDLRTGEGQR